MANSSLRILNPVTFDKLIQKNNPFNGGTPIFDLRGFELITPGALVPLAAGCHSLNKDGRKLHIVVDDERVRSYLIRCGFVNTVSNVAVFEPGIPTAAGNLFNARRGSSPLLIEVSKIENGAALPELLKKIIWILKNRLRYKKVDAFDIATAISEIGQNAFDHNSHTTGFIAMQEYGDGANRFIEIAVGDYGDGLATTLRRNPKIRPIISDEDAIHLATKLGISEYDDPTRGTGLFHLLEIAYKHQGSVQFRSDSAAVRYRMDKKQGWRFKVTPLPGVQITLKLSSKATS